MSQKDESENDIWDYKPLGKKKKQSAPVTVSKRRCISRKNSEKCSSAKSNGDKVETADNEDCSAVDDVPGDGHSRKENRHLPSRSCLIEDADQTLSGSSSEDFCPMCQMPFSILLVQTQRWHVAECLDTSRDSCGGIWKRTFHFLHATCICQHQFLNRSSSRQISSLSVC